MLTTQKQIRAEFWATHPDANRKLIRNYAGTGRMHTTDTRVAFCNFVDSLACDGRISDALAQRVTLQPTRMRTVWRVMGNYGQGWEELNECDTRAIARGELREYGIACPQGAHKLQRGRVAA